MSFPNSDLEVFMTLRGHIEQEKGSIAVFYNGEPFVVPTDKPSFVVTYTPAQSTRYAWDDDCPVDRRGVLFMNAHVPVSLQYTATQQLGFCAEASRIFPRGKIGRIEIPDGAELSGSGYSDQGGVFMYYPMQVRWRCFA